MISMQRSLSSPVCIRTSPPVSPTVTHRSRSRSPSPPPENHVDASRPRRRPSRSPARGAENNMSLPLHRAEDSAPRRASIQQPHGPSTSKKPIIAQPSVPSTSSTALRESHGDLEPLDSPPSAPADRTQTIKLPQPLLQDLSLYTNPHLAPQLIIESESTTLEELAHLVRLSKYQERKRANTRIRLQRSLISTALAARLTRCGEIAHRNLADSFRGDDKKTFAGLYNAILNVRGSCDELRRYALLEPEMETLQSPGGVPSEGLDNPAGSASVVVHSTSITPFLNDISASARDTFLSFLCQIRTNPDYLATRICSLNSSELAVLTSFHQSLEPIESVLPYHTRHSGRGSGSTTNRNTAHERTAIERLLSFHRHDPLSALIHTCFANSAGPDSAEDKRRMEIWATACAKLISEQKSGSEPILVAVLNVWTGMRDWSGRSNMEWFLMKILEDGAFLLDRAEDQHGTRFNLADWTAKDQIAAEEFYERATNELFEIVDDDDATGIPEGLFELGNEILKKLESKYVESTRKWFVYKWMFSVWLLGVVIHPESYGMMSEYHITEYGRQKILKQIAMRAQQVVVDMMWSKKTVSTPPKIKAHVDNILHRFRSRSGKSKPRLLPARSITSLRETVEVHPYLVVSPADLATLVNALFPERRPQSGHSSSVRSGAASISGFSSFSQPLSSTTRSNFDAISVISTSADSATSDAPPSTAGYLEEQRTGSSQRYSPPVFDPANQGGLDNYEDDGYRLRLAMHEMTQILGQDVVYGSCHPCAERWAVLFISADGNSLSTHMTYDPDDDPEEEENSSTSDTDEEEGEDERPELDKDYHQLRDSILKLVEDYEIPHSLDADGKKGRTFSNRATSLKKYRSKNKIITPEKSTSSRNPYRQRIQGQGAASTTEGSSDTKVSKEEASSEPTEDQSDSSSILTAMLMAASTQSRAQSDFVSAHLYWRTYQQLTALSSDSLRRNGFATLLNIFSRGPRDSIRRSAAAIEEYDAWLVWLKQSQERAEGLLDSMTRRLRALRDKMWYVTDVRNSAPYEASRNIAVALKTMGMPRKWDKFQRVRNQIARGPAASFLFRTETQIMDMIAAPEEQGGPNKLSDDQAEKTCRWLQDYGIENFCQGEERIHRFCFEIENCIGKLIGDTLANGPVLWSSELYIRDRQTLERSRSLRDRDNHPWDDSASVVSDPERRYASSVRAGSAARDLKAMSAHNASQASIDSGRFSFSRASTALSDIVDSQDYFGAMSPVHTIDSSTTFWSPFQAATSQSSATSRAHSPTTSMTNLSATFGRPSHSHQGSGRPGTSASSNETVFQQRQSEEKSRFLSDLRQTLTSLLLSDLGNLVFARGSETDGWFNVLGQECIERREALDRRARAAALKEKKKAAKNGPKQRILEKKKSFGDLRGAGGVESSDRASAHGSQGGDAPGMAGHGTESSATSDTVSGRTAQSQGGRRENAAPEFPFTKAYRRLLRMFCVHPNPYAKLNALFELEHLIVASLTSGSRRSRLAWARSDPSPPPAAIAGDHTGTGTPAPPRAKPLEEAIDNVKERRSHALVQPPSMSSSAAHFIRSNPGNPETRSIMSASNPMNTDAVSNVLRALFRDASIRPKTLFRDLQFIAAFVAPTVLDKPDRGKAFWDTGLAALSLKQEVCHTMVEVADQVVAFHTTYKGKKPSSGSSAVTSSAASVSASSASGDTPITAPSAAGPGSGSANTSALNSGLAEPTQSGTATATPGTASPSPPSSPPTPTPPPMKYSLADAARMYTVTAKEGDPTAARELAFFYMTYPELVERTTRPLAKPREVFKQAFNDMYGGGGGARGAGRSGVGSGAGGAAETGDVKRDPALMCIAFHWMGAAEKEGDETARQFLKQHEIVG